MTRSGLVKTSSFIKRLHILQELDSGKIGVHGIYVGRAVALRYIPAGRGFDSRWCHCNFSVTLSFRSHYGLGVDSASNRNEYQVYFLGVKAAGA